MLIDEWFDFKHVKSGKREGSNHSPPAQIFIFSISDSLQSNSFETLLDRKAGKLGGGERERWSERKAEGSSSVIGRSVAM